MSIIINFYYIVSNCQNHSFVNDNSSSDQFITNERMILTVAHNVVKVDNDGHRTNLEKHQIKIFVGSNELFSKEGTFVSVEKIIPHENYNPSRKINDIAIIILKEKLDFNNENITPTRFMLDYQLQMILDNELFYGVGWGNTENGTLIDKKLKMKPFPIISYKTCKKNNSMQKILNPGMMCFGFSGNHIVCKGDSGGGIFYQKDEEQYLVGLISLSIDFCKNENKTTYDYSIMTDISYYYNTWIQDEINKVNINF